MPRMPIPTLAPVGIWQLLNFTPLRPFDTRNHELRDPHAEAESGHRVEKEEEEILEASHQGETPDAEERDHPTMGTIGR